MSDLVYVDDLNFESEVLNSNIPVLVDFWAEWCPPCRMITPIIEELATEYKGKIKVAKLDVDKAPETASKYDITSIPSLIIFKSGTPMEKVVGAVPKNRLKGMMDSVL